MAKKRRRKNKIRWTGWLWRGLLAILLAFLLAALLGGLASVNGDWEEPDIGIPVYLSDNGVHVDIVMPVDAGGLDWSSALPRSDMKAVPGGHHWLAFGSGDKGVYLDTPTWADLTLRNAAGAILGNERVMHVQYVTGPGPDSRLLLLRPEEYRRLWAAVRAGFALGPEGQPQRLEHPGYVATDAFYEGTGRFNAANTCNQWVASRLRIAGVKAPLWSPFTFALTSRYRDVPLPN